jgi:hypothetical protein
MAARDSKGLPPALLNPPAGRYAVEDATRLWLHVYYGIGYDADPETQAYQREYPKAERDVRPLVQRKVIRERDESLANYVKRKGIDSRLGEADVDTWVERADLEKLAKQRGFSLLGSRGRPRLIPDEAKERARELANHMSKTEAAMQAAEEYGLTPKQGESIAAYLKPSRQG